MLLPTSKRWRIVYPIVLVLSAALLIRLALLVREMYPSHPRQGAHPSLAVGTINLFLGANRIQPGYWVQHKFIGNNDFGKWTFGGTPWGYSAGPLHEYDIGFDEAVRTFPSACLVAPVSARQIAGIRFMPTRADFLLTSRDRSKGREAFTAWLESELASHDPASNVSPPDDGTFLANVKELYVDEEIALPSGYLINTAALVLVTALVWSAAGITRCTRMLVSGLIHRRAHRERLGLCPSCGYDLHGLSSDVCPECGNSAKRST